MSPSNPAKPISAVSRKALTCLRMPRKRRGLMWLSLMASSPILELHVRAAGAARVVDLGEARGAHALGRTEPGAQVLDHEKLGPVQQRAHVPGDALLVQRHLLGQLGEQVVVDAA